MAIVFQERISWAGGTGDITSSSGEIDGTLANFAVINVQYQQGTSITVSDSLGNTWNPLTASASAGTVECRLYWAMLVNSSNTMTFTIAGTNIFASAGIHTFSGVSSSPFDVENGATGVLGTLQTGSVTPTLDNSLIVTGIGFNLDGTPLSIDSSFDNDDGNAGIEFGASNNYGSDKAYLIQGAKAAVNPTWTRTNTGANATRIAVFKVATSDPVTFTNPTRRSFMLTGVGT